MCAQAYCPVIIARGDEPSNQAAPVVVGIDGSASSRRAAEFALEAAASRGAPLLAMHAQVSPDPASPDGDVVAATLDGLMQRFPDVELRPTTVPGASAIEVLLFASTAAGLVVVGSRGLGGLRGLLLGSVSLALIQHAHCPVAVMGKGDDDRSSVRPSSNDEPTR